MFASFEDGKITHIADGKKGVSAGTGLSRLNMQDLKALARAIGFDELQAGVTARVRSHLKRVLSYGGLLPPKTLGAFVDRIVELDALVGGRLARFSERRREALRRLEPRERENLALQKETLGIALEISGISRDELLAWQPINGSQQSFLDGLPGAQVREDAMLLADFSDTHAAARGIENIADATIELPQHYIEIEGSLVQRALRTLKHGDAFAVFDNYGDIGVIGTGPEGLYFNDTRFLSWYELRFEGKRPLLLSSVVQDDNAALSVNLANPDVHIDGVISLPRGTIAIERTKFLWQAVCYERIGFRNYADSTRHFRIDIGFGADFHDLFEIRGTSRERRGTSTSLVTEDGARFHYEGLDKVKRKTELRFSPPPARLETNRATFEFELAPDARRSLFVWVLCEDRNQPRISPFGRAFRARRRAIRGKATGIATIESSNELFNKVCRQATADLYMLMTRTSHGLYPYAGIPWYSTAFGRDGIITAMLLLWLDSSVAKGVLHFLATTRAKTFDPFADAQPGKILHETRNGEMARLGEVPFGLYYGTVDATPLYVMLAGMYFDRTGDIETIAAIWPNINAALQWIDTFGDADGDGFVEYARQNASGLVNQGWKDSYDSIFHADGALAEGPIALCEVQGYVVRGQDARRETRASHGRV